MKNSKLNDLTAFEIQIFEKLGFEKQALKCVIEFLEDRIQNTKIEDLHNLGISLRSLKKTLQKLDPNNSLLKEEIKKGQVSAENINEEIVEMINLK